MPPAARTNDPTSHGKPLNPGPGSLDVQIGNMPAWRAVPSGMGAGIEDAANAMNDLMSAPQLDPASTPAKLAKIFSSMMKDSGPAAGKGAPAAPATCTSGFSTLVSANVTLTATYTTAAAVPGGQPAAIASYTQGIKAAAAAFASAAMAALAGLTDIHLCPVPCPPPPHGPGVVTKGSKSVVINNLPATRQTDKVFEACGGPDPIATGCPTVLIGDDGGGPGAGGGAGAAAATADDDELTQQAESATAALSDAAESGAALIETTRPCGGLGNDKIPKRVAFQVLDDDTGQPRPGVQLHIRLPDGSEETQSTDGNGMIEIEQLKQDGVCEVTGDFTNVTNDQTYDFVRSESRPV